MGSLPGLNIRAPYYCSPWFRHYQIFPSPSFAQVPLKVQWRPVSRNLIEHEWKMPPCPLPLLAIKKCNGKFRQKILLFQYTREEYQHYTYPMAKFLGPDRGDIVDSGKGLSYTVIHFVCFNAKFGTCTVVSVNGTLVESKMCTFTLESKHFIFNMCPFYTHDGASAKLSTNSLETDYSVPARQAT